MNKETKKIEAIKRMYILDLHQPCIDAFEKDNEIWLSEADGILFDLSQRPHIKKAIEDLEKEYDIFVYHGILTPTDFGLLVSLFYVSDEFDEWNLDYLDMEEDCACCYVINLDDDMCSEFGNIKYERKNGGLVRIA